MVYCPYTDTDLNNSQISSEHIIPLSLGGLNGFEIPVCKKFNSYLGSKIDGALANDFFILMKRNEHDVRGHSKKRPVYVAKKSLNVMGYTPLQATLDRKNGLKLWCPIEKRQLQGNEGKKFSMSMECDMNLYLQFVAKTALSAGYFAYGDLFREKVMHEELRFIMNSKPLELGPQAHGIQTTVDHLFSGLEQEGLNIFRLVCDRLPGASIIGLVPSNNRLTVFVGILGMYIGTVSVPADTRPFPNEGSYNWGHLICPQDGKLKRVSFARVLEKLAEHA